jgi:O-antigen/teichoic acid export membrane protein
LIGSAFAIAAVQNLDLLLLKRYAADEALVGYYTAAMNLARAPYFLFSAFTMTALPLVANALGRSDESDAGGTVREHTTLLVLMGAPGLALAAGAPESILRLLYPADYGAAALPLVMLVASMLLLSAFAMFNAVLAAMGQPYRAMALVGVSIPLQAGLGIVLIPRYGMTGAGEPDVRGGHRRDCGRHGGVAIRRPRSGEARILGGRGWIGGLGRHGGCPAWEPRWDGSCPCGWFCRLRLCYVRR